MAYKSTHTGQQIDAGVDAALNPDTTPTEGSNALMTSGGVKSALDTFVRPNLLDNWYFVGGGSQQGNGAFPINQRGQTIYSGPGYGIDRFKMEGPYSVTVNADYVTFADTTIQLISLAQLKELVGRTVTISSLQYYNGQTHLVSASGIVNPHTQDTIIEANFIGGGILSFRIFANSGSYQACRIWSGDVSHSVDLIAVKLELGDTQTLAHQENGVWVLNEIPNYQEELAKCQRYFLALGMHPYSRFGFGTAQTTTIIYINVPIPVTMYTGTITCSYSGAIALESGSTVITEFAKLRFDSVSQNFVSIAIDSSNPNLTVGACYILRANADSAARLYISADL